MTATTLFDVGEIHITPGALALPITLGETDQVIRRHKAGDWGELCPEDRDVNEAALGGRGRILSEYALAAGTVWVVTEADRRRTTICLPVEY